MYGLEAIHVEAAGGNFKLHMLQSPNPHDDGIKNVCNPLIDLTQTDYILSSGQILCNVH